MKKIRLIDRQTVRGKRTKTEVIRACFLSGSRLKFVFTNGHLDLDKCCNESKKEVEE